MLLFFVCNCHAIITSITPLNKSIRRKQRRCIKLKQREVVLMTGSSTGLGRAVYEKMSHICNEYFYYLVYNNI